MDSEEERLAAVVVYVSEKKQKKKKKTEKTHLDKTFVDFYTFQTISLHHKWNETRSLSPEIECTSYLMRCQTT